MVFDVVERLAGEYLAEDASRMQDAVEIFKELKEESWQTKEFNGRE